MFSWYGNEKWYYRRWSSFYILFLCHDNVIAKLNLNQKGNDKLNNMLSMSSIMSICNWFILHTKLKIIKFWVAPLIFRRMLQIYYEILILLNENNNTFKNQNYCLDSYAQGLLNSLSSRWLCKHAFTFIHQY